MALFRAKRLRGIDESSLPKTPNKIRKTLPTSEIFIHRNYSHTFTFHTNESQAQSAERLRQVLSTIPSQPLPTFVLNDNRPPPESPSEKIKAQRAKRLIDSRDTKRLVMQHAVLEFRVSDIPPTDVQMYYSSDIRRLFRIWDDPASAVLKIKGISVPPKYYSIVFSKNVPETWDVIKKQYSECLVRILYPKSVR